jgi:hypothetical protein
MRSQSLFEWMIWTGLAISLSSCERMLIAGGEPAREIQSSSAAVQFDNELNLIAPAQRASISSEITEFFGSCPIGVDISIAYGPGVSGPPSAPCFQGEFRFQVSFNGEEGMRLVSITQDVLGSPMARTVDRAIRYAPPVLQSNSGDDVSH